MIKRKIRSQIQDKPVKIVCKHFENFTTVFKAQVAQKTWAQVEQVAQTTWAQVEQVAHTIWAQVEQVAHTTSAQVEQVAHTTSAHSTVCWHHPSEQPPGDTNYLCSVLVLYGV